MTGNRTAFRLTLGAWLLYLSVLAPSLATWDGAGMLNVAVSVLQKHDLTVEPVFGTPGRGGKLYDGHYPLLSFVVIPFAAMGLFAAGYSHLPPIYFRPGLPPPPPPIIGRPKFAAPPPLAP